MASVIGCDTCWWGLGGADRHNWALYPPSLARRRLVEFLIHFLQVRFDLIEMRLIFAAFALVVGFHLLQLFAQGGQIIGAIAALRVGLQIIELVRGVLVVGFGGYLFFFQGFISFL